MILVANDGSTADRLIGSWRAAAGHYGVVSAPIGILLRAEIGDSQAGFGFGHLTGTHSLIDHGLGGAHLLMPSLIDGTAAGKECQQTGHDYHSHEDLFGCAEYMALQPAIEKTLGLV